jgi:hypothetical protein
MNQIAIGGVSSSSSFTPAFDLIHSDPFVSIHRIQVRRHPYNTNNLGLSADFCSTNDILASHLLAIRSRQEQEQLQQQQTALNMLASAFKMIDAKKQHVKAPPPSTITKKSLKQASSPMAVSSNSAETSVLSSKTSVAPGLVSSTTTTTTTSSAATPMTPRKKKGEKWLAMLDVLRRYKEEHGSCIVPRGYTLNPQLASWVAEQRKQFKLLKDGKSSSITPERILMLDNLGFAWNAQEAAWEKHVADLKSFIGEHRHCNVPLKCSKYPKLGLWVKEQRRHYTLMKQGKPSHMTPARVKELSCLGFRWDTHEAAFLTRLRQLKEYKDRYGTCLVPTSYPKLGTWCHHQRRQYKKWKEGKESHITQERIDKLEELGFVWNPRENKNEVTTTASSASSVSSLDSEQEEEEEDLDTRPRKRQKSV